MIVRSCAWVVKATQGKWIANGGEDARLIKGVSTDTRKIATGSLFIPLIGENFDGHDFLEQAITGGAIATLWQADHPLPQVNIPIIQVEDTLRALQQMAHQYRVELAIPIIAITGSNGKTTTKDLVGSVLSTKYNVSQTAGNLNNHIGLPLTLLSMSDETEIGVVEMGMNHAGEIALLSRIAKPNIAVITNIGESHLENLGSRAGIATAKWEIIEGLAEDGVVYLNGDEPLLQQKIPMIKNKSVRLGFMKTNDEYPVEIQAQDLTGIQFTTNYDSTPFSLPLLGKHNILNALYAIQIGRHFDLGEKEIQTGLANAKISGMRLEVKQAKNGMLMIDDAYNASPTSMKAALNLQQTLEPQLEKWVLLGDMREIGEDEERYHREIGAIAIEKKVDRIYTIGDRGKWIAAGAQEACDKSCMIHHFHSIDEASAHLQEEGNRNVLLLIKASQAMRLDKIVQKLI